jgi:hypothetical protein
MVDPELTKLSKNELENVAINLACGIKNGTYQVKLRRDDVNNLAYNTHYHNNQNLRDQLFEEAKQDLPNNVGVRSRIQSRILSELEARLGSISENIPEQKVTNPWEIIQEPGTKVSVMPIQNGNNYYYYGISVDDLAPRTRGIVKSTNQEAITVRFDGGTEYRFSESELTLVNGDEIIAEREAHNNEPSNKMLSPEEFKARIVPPAAKLLRAKRSEIKGIRDKAEGERYSHMANYIVQRTGKRFSDMFSGINSQKEFERAVKKMTKEIKSNVRREFDVLMEDFVENASQTIGFDKSSRADLEEIARKTKFSRCYSDSFEMGYNGFENYLLKEVEGINRNEGMDIAYSLSYSLSYMVRDLKNKQGVSLARIEKILAGEGDKDAFEGMVYDAKNNFEEELNKRVRISQRSINDMGLYSGEDSEKVGKFMDDWGDFLLSNEVKKIKTRGLVITLLAEKLQEAEIIGDDWTINLDLVNKAKKKRHRFLKADVKTFVDEKGLKIKSAEQKRYVYVPDPTGQFREGNLDPYRIGEEFLRNLLTTSKKRSSTNRQKAIVTVAEELIKSRRVMPHGDFKSAMSKPSKIVYHTIRERLGEELQGEEPSRKFRKFSIDGKVCPDHGYQYNAEFLRQSGLYLLQRDLVVEEMIAELSHGTKKGTGGIGDEFRIFWERFQPEEYDLHAAPGFVRTYGDGLQEKNLGAKYSFQLSRCKDTLAKAITNAGACLKDGDIDSFTEDPGTLNLIAYNSKEEPIGYTRFVLTKENKGEATLGMDTIEVGHKHFNSYWDWMRTTGLASMQLGLDMGAKYVVGDDGRVAYGPRQAFGNYYRDPTKLYKIGETDYKSWGGRGLYSFHFDKHRSCSGKTSILFRNWNNSKPKSKKKKSKAKLN